METYRQEKKKKEKKVFEAFQMALELLGVNVKILRRPHSLALHHYWGTDVGSAIF